MASLRYLSAHAEGRRVAVLGDMLELGDRSDAFHRAMGRFAARCADMLFFFGMYADAYADGARADGGATVFKIDGDICELSAQIAPYLCEKDTVLFKASHALGADAIAQELEKYFS
jgi:UDP-N-acetylmuramoyl-tripeptide--D-alanyl-D-alanine ligase